MAKERGLFQLIFKEFIKSISPKFSKRVHVGTDYMGTKYYEVHTPHSIRRKSNRYFEPANKEDFEQELPAEWEAWLRNRRREPPTEAEVKQNYEMILLKRKNAAELEATYIKETDSVAVLDPKGKSLDQHASLNYPVYDEYKQFGRNYQPKWKK
ncbi:NADH dehydrogenase [ubiquinone] 1 alpha subcomplex assembly factor 2 [Phymastichus coffea]|uniref:NADH dehydrogenase [ubiquinone] 1 alpha subcomplex assembly factor 2 n=1 Tax=Phymastichus coffea TaxID=108790 RepID=UPI00273A9DF0|nr:NADH dehydrogenase [ubiquinone] 1 alpha subcomplex assembly factor 2 [Phymastichus coffea]XP_058808161.1 NADH dehydrogenase [ubiquinone] 1 alpha subcomplex assembly factor 2 [Phymastichus coffea]XP_058808162.1 NADH dehydrogenase [ubiquinone] 1 alpha subcomplex assembly factor 2 [Phymastichus coffea]XP_058808163.1 NADH dehydrogenase [ubiquinone] 1 alpha subcomplex assembly factor 2 [Phymastichus coffea]XP_058808164.1 NADH dehydrogenase [ubiquinone] 1 alpha subcomplex assembly factor 2 [Phymas